MGLLATGGPLGPEAAGILCGVSIAAVAAEDVFKFFGLFSGPTFHGTLKPRPGSVGQQPWDDTFGIPYPGLNSIGEAIGLPSDGCEFGACGGITTFAEGQASQSDNKPTIDILPPWISQRRYEQRPRPGRPTPRNIPREVQRPAPDPNELNGPSTRWERLIRALSDLGGISGLVKAFPIIVDPTALCPYSPANGPYRLPYCSGPKI